MYSLSNNIYCTQFNPLCFLQQFGPRRCWSFTGSLGSLWYFTLVVFNLGAKSRSNVQSLTKGVSITVRNPILYQHFLTFTLRWEHNRVTRYVALVNFYLSNPTEAKCNLWPSRRTEIKWFNTGKDQTCLIFNKPAASASELNKQT